MRGPLLASALLLCSASASAQTEVHIKLAGQGKSLPKLALALPAFAAADASKSEDARLARELREVLREDLMFSRYFDLLEDGPAFNAENIEAIAPQWKSKGAAWLAVGKVQESAGTINLTVSLRNLDSGETAFERFYKQESRFLRAVAHRVADDLVQQTTGRKGIARTQIAFANNQSGNKEIFLVDYDGENLRQLTKHGSISLLPRLSPDRRKLIYTSYKDANPDLFLLDLEKGKTRVLSDQQGLNVGGGFSPDGSQLLMTLSRQKSPNLFVKNLEDGSLSQLTQHFGADSSPTFSPDAVQVAFVSDRSGNPQIYILDMNTQRAKRLTNLNWCDSPSWSPTGEWIAFSGRANPKDKLDIFLVDVTGTQLRQLTKLAGSNENPSWSPDGRFLAFSSTRNGRAELFVMDADGSAPHRLVELPAASSTPDWK